MGPRVEQTITQALDAAERAQGGRDGAHASRRSSRAATLLLDASLGLAGRIDDGYLARLARLYTTMLDWRDGAGRERAIGVAAFTMTGFTLEESAELRAALDMQVAALERYALFAPDELADRLSELGLDEARRATAALSRPLVAWPARRALLGELREALGLGGLADALASWRATPGADPAAVLDAQRRATEHLDAIARGGLLAPTEEADLSAARAYLAALADEVERGAAPASPVAALAALRRLEHDVRGDARQWWTVTAGKIEAAAPVVSALEQSMTDHVADAYRASLQAALFEVVAVLLAVVLALGLARIGMERVAALQHVVTRLVAMGEGDYAQVDTLQTTRPDDPDEVGDLERAAFDLTDRTRDIVTALQASAAELQASAAELNAGAQELQAGIAEQNAAADQTKRTLSTLLAAADAIAGEGDQVLDAAKLSERNAELMADRVRQLSSQTSQIDEILSLIKDIANKTELLSLNAALEGTKAGEAGRGFSVVATQMQRLAEQVVGLVGRVGRTTSDIEQSTHHSVLATEEAGKLAGATTSAASRINLAVRQQRSGTEEVGRAMDDILGVVAQSRAAVDQFVQSAEEVTARADHLLTLAARFRT